jgi:phosphohistidine phosphatase SixA
MIPLFHVRGLLAGAVLSAAMAGAHHAHANDVAWQKLAEGGKVVLMRHAAVNTGRGQGNSLLRDPSCKKERNLSSEGERAAREVGRQFQERGIPVSEVLHSPFCRTADTARIAFARGTPAAYLSLLEVLGPEAAAAQTRTLTDVIGGYAGKGNLVLITHEPNLNAVSFEMMKHSDFLVLQPKGGSEFEELGVVRWREKD